MDAPRDDLVRALPVLPFRAASDDEGEYLGVMHGEFTPFGRWTEINSAYEGRFLERVARGAFSKTIAESRDKVKVLFDHGQDPQIGNKVLGPIRSLEERDTGAFYEVPLFDTTYNRDLHPGIKAGEYGASFRFAVVKDAWEERPGRSAHNPDGLPERTLQEVRLYEFGPVTFPAYADASAGLRSMTDEYRARTSRPLIVSTDLRTLTDSGAATAGTPEVDGAADNPPAEPLPALAFPTSAARKRALSLLELP